MTRPTDDEIPEGHPLFPPRDDARDPPLVTHIHVTRWEGGKTPKFCPQLFEADELTDLSQLFDWFGGGEYELIGRNAERGRITARASYSIPGPSRPLVPSSEPEPREPPVARSAPSLVNSDGMLAMMMQMMQLQSQQSMQMFQHTTQLITAVMNRDGESSKAHVQSMQLLHDRSLQSQAELTRAIVESKSQGGSAKELVGMLREGLQMGREMAAPDDDDDDDVSDTLGQVAEIMGAADRLQGGGAGAEEGGES